MIPGENKNYKVLMQERPGSYTSHLCGRDGKHSYFGGLHLRPLLFKTYDDALYALLVYMTWHKVWNLPPYKVWINAVKKDI